MKTLLLLLSLLCVATTIRAQEEAPQGCNLSLSDKWIMIRQPRGTREPNRWDMVGEGTWLQWQEGISLTDKGISYKLYITAQNSWQVMLTIKRDSGETLRDPITFERRDLECAYQWEDKEVLLLYTLDVGDYKRLDK